MAIDVHPGLFHFEKIYVPFPQEYKKYSPDRVCHFFAIQNCLQRATTRVIFNSAAQKKLPLFPESFMNQDMVNYPKRLREIRPLIRDIQCFPGPPEDVTETFQLQHQYPNSIHDISYEDAKRIVPNLPKFQQITPLPNLPVILPVPNGTTIVPVTIQPDSWIYPFAAEVSRILNDPKISQKVRNSIIAILGLGTVAVVIFAAAAPATAGITLNLSLFSLMGAAEAIILICYLNNVPVDHGALRLNQETSFIHMEQDNGYRFYSNSQSEFIHFFPINSETWIFTDRKTCFHADSYSIQPLAPEDC
jgi:hypothetical protein